MIICQNSDERATKVWYFGSGFVASQMMKNVTCFVLQHDAT